MTTQLLASELANLIQESKRKHNDLRQAAEKSLEELKSLKGAPKLRLSQLSQRVNFVNPFIIACGTKNVKFTGIAILNQVLEALREATSAGLDVQLKILQALPSLLQNYASDVKGDMLVTALNICFILQASKNAIVNNTSAATLQQLVVSVFDKVTAEDKSPGDAPFVGEAPVADGTVQVRTAALDAFRVFNDLCLMTENQRPEYLRFTGLSQTFGLELIESVLTNHAAIFLSHPEQAQILRVRVMPFIISALNHKANFATSVRLVRILYTLLRRHVNILPVESGQALDILTQLLDQDAPITEKPNIIGLSHQSTIPVSNPYSSTAGDVMLESGGVTGMISGSSSADGGNTGISVQWSSVRVPFIDQLDKTEPPPIPESYVYNLTLAFKICAAIIDECWPAILATCSTFLNAALDSEYYHGLVRAFQKFAHVAGLLHLNTPRDAFLTTLGKAAVPPNVFTACLNLGGARPSTPTAPDSAGGLLSNARGLLSRENLALHPQASEKNRQPSWSIILETLQQADFVLFSSGKIPGRIPTAIKGQDPQAENEANALLQNFGGEIRAVETAAARLIESTVDFPNKPFVEVVEAICNLLDSGPPETPSSAAHNSTSPPPTASTLKPGAGQHRRVLSVSTPATAGPTQEDMLALSKLGDVATVNIERLLSYPPDESGWAPLTTELIRVLNASSMYASVRTRAAEILIRLVLESASVAGSLEEDDRGKVQLRLLEAVRDALRPLQAEDRDVSVAHHGTDIEIHKIILDGLKSMLENCGDALVSGWTIVFEIIGSIFVYRKFGLPERRGTQAAVLMTRSAKLIRPSFNSLELICSDFLTALPNSCFLKLVDTLYEFCTQDDDLNIALTNKSLSITSELMQGRDASDLIKMASDPGQPVSDAALWMLLLLRLTKVTTDDRLELRNSAIQTLLRIFDAYGERLSSEAWSVCIESVLFKLLSSIEEELEAASGDEADDRSRGEWNDTAVVVLNGISTLVANYLEPLTQHASFDSLWRELVDHFRKLLDFDILDINTAVFNALGKILAQTRAESTISFSRASVDLSWDLWSRRIPVSVDEESKQDNQNTLLAYVSALQDVYRLIEPDLTVERADIMLKLLRQSMQHATAGSYVADIEYMTPLQGKILEAVRAIRVNVKGMPAVVVSEVAEFVAMAFKVDVDRPSTTASKRTFVAMSKASMAILQDLILSNSADEGIYSRGSYVSALGTLAIPITMKYRFPIITKSVQPWRLATSTVLAILEGTLSQLKNFEHIPDQVTQNTWHEIVKISSGIVSADCNRAPDQGAHIAADESFDIEAFLKLRDLIIPSLGSEIIPDKTRKAFAESLFRTSIIHQPSPEEIKLLSNNSGDALTTLLHRSRHGRTAIPAAAKRARMSYVCLDELFSLISTHDDPATPSIVVQPPTPKFAPAPYLILRSALVLRAYIADQPLRGRMPQPLSQRKELLHILHRLAELKSESEAIPDTPNARPALQEGTASSSRKRTAAAEDGDEKSHSLYRAVYDAQNSFSEFQLPGTLVRAESQPPTKDKAVNDAYDNVGRVLSVYKQLFRWNSVDNHNMHIISTVHFGENYENA
ncbi:unnamed protein product, partial [Parascedosporium putredinis]